GETVTGRRCLAHDWKLTKRTFQQKCSRCGQIRYLPKNRRGKEKRESKVAKKRVTRVEGLHCLTVLGTPSDESLTSLSFHSQCPHEHEDNLTRPMLPFSPCPVTRR